MQKKHVSDLIWNNVHFKRVLHIRRASSTYRGREYILEQIQALLEEFGFLWACKLAYIKIDGGLIQALIERWRPETHIPYALWGVHHHSSGCRDADGTAS